MYNLNRLLENTSPERSDMAQLIGLINELLDLEDEVNEIRSRQFEQPKRQPEPNYLIPLK
ncbi:hypothetical protein EVB91_243 [Rhizobium phage RHph_I1_18]|nr:hypothetical protein EVB91_243 [Rhizobium phage RHph_I1_18]